MAVASDASVRAPRRSQGIEVMARDTVKVPREDIAEALAQACEYFENRSDVIDGDYGVPEPNTEMRLAQMCNDALAIIFSSDPEGGERGVQGSTADGQQCNEQQPQALSRAYGVIDPDYARIFTIARCLAWAEGYALAMHGSFTRDLDLIAVPWAARACDPEHLAKRIESAAGLKITVPPKNDKPHNRLVWTMTLPEFGDPRFVDLSIIPPQHEVELSEEDVRMIDQAWETHKAALPLTAQALAEEIHIQMSVNKTCVVSGANALAKALLEKFKITQLTKTPSADHDDSNLRGLAEQGRIADGGQCTEQASQCLSLADFDHLCTDRECPIFGQRSCSSNCRCHKTREQMMLDEINRLRKNGVRE